jgi:septal ring factor EnvC (AmiA/AmiB activator)
VVSYHEFDPAKLFFIIIIAFCLLLGELEAKSKEKESQYEARLEAKRRDLAAAREQVASQAEAVKQLNKQLEEQHKRNRDLETEAVKRTELMTSVEKELKGNISQEKMYKPRSTENGIFFTDTGMILPPGKT